MADVGNDEGNEEIVGLHDGECEEGLFVGFDVGRCEGNIVGALVGCPVVDDYISSMLKLHPVFDTHSFSNSIFVQSLAPLLAHILTAFAYVFSL